MKRIIYIILAATAAFTACKKDESAKINDVTIQVVIGNEPVTDAVEVTVASHEFERNLEQGEKWQQEEGERQQEQISHRRNLDLSMVQEMAGELSEEEALAAQIMQDNGNSVDLTA